MRHQVWEEGLPDGFFEARDRELEDMEDLEMADSILMEICGLVVFVAGIRAAARK